MLDAFVTGRIAPNPTTTFEMLEAYVGGHLRFQARYAHPYVGAGLTVAQVDVDVDIGGGDKVGSRDTSLGAYARAGVSFDLGEDVEIGFDLRGVFGTKGEILGVSGDADYVQGTLFLGLRF